MVGSTPAIRLSPIFVHMPYMQSSKRFCSTSGSMASRLPVDWKQSRHPVSMADSLSISSKPITPQRRRISVFRRGRCLGSGCFGRGERVIQPLPRFVPIATSLGFFAMKRSNEVSAVVNWVFNEATNSSAESGRSEEHTSELQSRQYLVCRLLLEKKKKIISISSNVKDN